MLNKVCGRGHSLTSENSFLANGRYECRICRNAVTAARRAKSRTTRLAMMRWRNIINRCYNPDDSRYKHYGARGIEMCARWLRSFAAFADDMGDPPTPDHSLDRRDNNGPYSPDNCRWATSVEQQRNRRNNRLLTYQGETLTTAGWAERLGIPQTLISSRLGLKSGWTTEQVLFGKQRAEAKKKATARVKVAARANVIATAARTCDKLSTKIADQIRDMYASKLYTQKQIGMHFGISRPQVSRIVTGLQWKKAA